MNVDLQPSFPTPRTSPREASYVPPLLHSGDISCPVKCISIQPDIQRCFIGRGPYIECVPLVAADDDTAPSYYSTLAFGNDSSGTSVHGICLAYGKQSSDETLGVFGGRHVSLFRGGIHSDFVPISRGCIKASDWIWDMRVKKIEERNGFLIALGLAHNSCQIWDYSQGHAAKLIRKLQCETRCITYSMSFFGWEHKNDTAEGWSSHLDIAVGTVYNEILLWNVWNDTHEHQQNCSTEIIPPSHRLFGHEGVIFYISIHPSGKLLASTSDDRSVRLWKKLPKNNDLSDSSTFLTSPSNKYELLWTGFGHTARVWDVSFSKLGLVTAGEDGTLRLWDMEYGDAIAVMRAGRQNIWKVSSHAEESVAITAGNDGSVKVWDLTTATTSKMDQDDHLTVPKDDTSLSKQIICGIDFHPQSPSSILIVTKAGSLFTFNNEDTRKTWETHAPWYHDNHMKPKGNCLAIHPKGDHAAIGTTGGHIFIVDILPSEENIHQSTNKYINVLSASKYFTIQNLFWVDPHNLLAAHIKGILTWWSFPSTLLNPTQKYVLNMGTSAIPTSFDFDKSEQLLVAGDSRGNLALFQLWDHHQSANEDENETNIIVPCSTLPNVHRKEHVNCILFSSHGRKIISGGNDGFVHECVVENKNTLRHCTSLPIHTLSSVTQIWKKKGDTNIFVSGFFGNDFFVWDVDNECPLFSVPEMGGRQRRSIFRMGLDGNTNVCEDFSLVFCFGRKDGSNDVYVRSTHGPRATNVALLGLSNLDIPDNSSYYRRYMPFHNDTITSVCFSPSSSSPRRTFLLSGGNDTTIRLSFLKTGTEKVLNLGGTNKELPPHESCIRGVYCSKHPESTSTLLMVAGGKLTMSFFRLDEEAEDFSVHFLSTSRSRSKKRATIDHRINVIKAVPIPQCFVPFSHLVVAGDSDGKLHISVVTEDSDQKRQLADSNALCDWGGRPIICLDIITIRDQFALLFAGNTAGEVGVWKISFQSCVSSWDDIQSISPIHVYKAHQVGANALSVMHRSCVDNAQAEEVIICSGGDDQALTTCHVRILVSQKSASLEVLHFHIHKGASYSSIKALKLIKCDEYNYRIYTIGYDQRLSLWLYKVGEKNSLQFCTRSFVNITDVNCLDCITVRDSYGCPHEVVVVGGSGVQLFFLNLSIFRAALSLVDANYLLVTAGAGMSADSGLQTYESMPEEYQDMCNPAKIVTEQDKFQQCWWKFANVYQKSKPHEGYNVLEEWCIGGKLRNLLREELSQVHEGKQKGNDAAKAMPWWVYSSNVDDHFKLFKSFANNFCGIHGSALEYRCASGIGFSNGENRIGEMWETWIKKISQGRTQLCSDTVISINHATDVDSMKCESCDSLLRPNVLMFHDTDENVLQSIAIQRERYQEWEERVEQQVSSKKRNLVILELGCGTNFPAVRDESEEVLRDCALKNKGSGIGHGTVTLIRVNPKDNGCDVECGCQDDGNCCNTISIREGSLQALNSIDAWVNCFLSDNIIKS